MKMTDTAIAKLIWKPKTYVLTNFARGLRLAVYARGRKTWQLRYSNPQTGRQAVTLLGHWPEMSCAQARKTARQTRALLERGEDLKKLPARISVEAFAIRWIADVVEKVRKDARPVESALKREVLPRLGHKPMAAIRAEHVRALIFAKRDAGRPAAAAALRHLIKRMFDYAVAVGIVAANPVLSVPLKYVTQHKTRSRSLNQSELTRFFQKLPLLGFKNAAALELILLTLCRKGELMGARWKHIDFEAGTWEVPADLSKSGRAHVVYLSERALGLLHILALASDPSGLGAPWTTQQFSYPDWYLFPHQYSRTQPQGLATLNKAIARVKWGIPHFTVHDMRRTAATLLSEKGYAPDWIEKALNHSIKGIRGVYNRAQYAEQRKKMLQEWADWLEELKDA